MSEHLRKFIIQEGLDEETIQNTLIKVLEEKKKQVKLDFIIELSGIQEKEQKNLEKINKTIEWVKGNV